MYQTTSQLFTVAKHTGPMCDHYTEAPMNFLTYMYTLQLHQCRLVAREKVDGTWPPRFCHLYSLSSPNRGEILVKAKDKAKVLNFNLQVLSGKGWFSQGEEG